MHHTFYLQSQETLLHLEWLGVVSMQHLISWTKPADKRHECDSPCWSLSTLTQSSDHWHSPCITVIVININQVFAYKSSYRLLPMVHLSALTELWWCSYSTTSITSSLIEHQEFPHTEPKLSILKRIIKTTALTRHNMNQSENERGFLAMLQAPSRKHSWSGKVTDSDC